MLRIIVAILCVVVAHAIPFTDCATDKANTAFTVHSLDIIPATIIVPGDIHFSLNATVNRRIDSLFIDVAIHIVTKSGYEINFPCIGDTNFGSCNNIDACSIMTDILSGYSVSSTNVGQQLDQMFIAALGHSVQCPISPEEVVVQNFKMTLPPFSYVWNQLLGPERTYHIKIMIKEDPTDKDNNVGCIDFRISLSIPSNNVG
ncbi:hypothetical protein ACF0H5_013702 [Mactra antiquata]